MSRDASRTIQVGDRVRFDDKSTSWLARAETPDGRYTLLTGSMFGNVHYTIIDWQRQMRGPMNVIGWGLGIFTTSGPDPAIDKAIEMLRPSLPFPDDEPCGFELSHRGEVPLSITRIVPQGAR